MSEYDYPHYEEDEWEDRVERFADPGGDSALHAAGPDNPRDKPCPTCGWPNRLTARDVASGYQCDSCARANEEGRDIYYYEGEEDEPDDDLEEPFEGYDASAAAGVAPDAHLEADYEDRVSGDSDV